MSDVRDTRQRIQDVRTLLRSERDAWVPSANGSGDAYIIPLSFSWDGELVTMATPRSSQTARNLRRAGWARIALGSPLDVVIIEGTLSQILASDAGSFADEHAQAVGFDAREQTQEYVFFRLTPERIQAWRSPAELPARDVMRAGRWLA
ncbi:MAG TPA: hypothetical protein VFV93_11740 [Thermomicrobiales bacterium]|nr:hypothetical protein [Thermomicrobiales bacterium]